MVLPPCVVCGGPALTHEGWTSTLDEGEATKLLGHAPPEERSVIDPADGRRLWVGHEDCTGITLRTSDRWAEDLADRLEHKTQSQAQHLERIRQAEAQRLWRKRQLDARGLSRKAAKRQTNLTCAKCRANIPYLATEPLLREYWDDWDLLDTLAWKCEGCSTWLCPDCGHGTPVDNFEGGHPHCIRHLGCNENIWRIGFSSEAWKDF